MLIELIKGEETDGLAGKLIPDTLTINGKTTRFVRGLVYQREVSSNGHPSTLTEIELVYERPNHGLLYVVKPVSLDTFNSNSEFFPVEDLRYLIFGSRKLYKAFFQVLNEEKRKKLISKEGYLHIFHKVNTLSNEMYRVLGGACVLLKRRVIRDYRKELEQDPLVRRYIDIARTYLIS